MYQPKHVLVGVSLPKQKVRREHRPKPEIPFSQDPEHCNNFCPHQRRAFSSMPLKRIRPDYRQPPRCDASKNISSCPISSIIGSCRIQTNKRKVARPVYTVQMPKRPLISPESSQIELQIIHCICRPLLRHEKPIPGLIPRRKKPCLLM